MYKGKSEAYKLNRGQMVICRCPDWCNEGYQVAEWNGEEFEYDAQPNGAFDSTVVAFLPIDEDGEPFPSYYDGFFKNEFRNKN